MATKKVQIRSDDAIKGVSYKAGQVAEFEADVAAAIVYHKRGTIVPDETPITPITPIEEPKSPPAGRRGKA